MLSAYRVIDLTDHGGLLCGQILADLGADVIQVEPPGGSSARPVGPWRQDAPGASRSRLHPQCRQRKLVFGNVLQFGEDLPDLGVG